MNENNLQEFWNIALDQIKNEFISQNRENEFKLWFNLSYIKDSIDKIYVSVASDFMWQKVKGKKYIQKIEESLKQISGIQNIEIIPVIKNDFSIKSAENSTEKQNSEQKKETKEEKTEIQPEKTKKKNPTLDERFTFDSFIPGEGTSAKFAYNVALSVAQNPGKKANPILLYGGVGLGKTHLMQAVGNYICENSKENLKIVYIQAESFLNEYTAGILSKEMNKFNKKFRTLDVLLLDDIHFLQGKEGIQNELFHTFNALYDKKAQMIFTCDRPLKEIQKMADRLVSRLGMGMCLDLQAPDYETRKAILYKKLEIKNRYLTEDVVDCIARTIETNVRDLESALNRILGYEEFIGSAITVDIVQEQLSNIYDSPSAGNISIENIMKVVAEEYNVTVERLKSVKRDKKTSDARFIAIYIAREMTEYSFMELGSEFGGRDHTSIMHGYNKMKEKIKTEPIFGQQIKNLMEKVKKFIPNK